MSDPSNGASAPNNLQQQRKLAKELLKAARSGDAEAIARLRAHVDDVNKAQLADAQLAIAREAGFDSWPKLVHELEKIELRQAHAALQHGDAATLRRLLHSSPSLRRKVNEPLGAFGSRPIQMAARHRDVLDVLIDLGADVNLKSDWSNGPFSVLDYCDEQTARHLIDHRGAILTAHAAARLGWLDELRKILHAKPEVVHEKGGDGQRPLHFAKTPEIAAFLLDHGADIDARCVDHHSTAAQYALVERPDVCRFLLERGATPDIFMAARLGDVALAEQLIAQDPRCLEARVNWPGYALVPPFNIYCWTLGFFFSPRDVASNFANQDVADLLAQRASPIVRLLDAAWNGDEPAARAVLRSEPKLLSSLSSEHHGLLAQAIHHQRDAAVKLMLELGFDPAAGGIDGGTALHQAAWVGRVDYLQTLLPRSKNLINRPDPTHGSTPLGWAAFGSVHRCNDKGDYVKTVEALVSAGADVTSPGNKFGARMLNMADGNPLVQETLRRLGAT